MPESIYPAAHPGTATTRHRLAPETDAAFQAFSRQVFADGALPARTKQLIAVASPMLPSARIASADTRRPRCARARRARN
jgi:hypothetical protein